jgi:hypothetical protein
LESLEGTIFRENQVVFAQLKSLIEQEISETMELNSVLINLSALNK